MSGATPLLVAVVVGRIGRAHGVRGEVAVEVRTDEPERRFRLGVQLLTDDGEVVVDAVRRHGERLLLRLHGIDDRSAAEALRGTELRVLVPAAERPADPEEYYDRQLVGLRVATATGGQLGSVSRVLHLSGAAVLAITAADGSEVLVPFVAAAVPAVDLDRGVLVVTPDVVAVDG